MDVTKEQKEDCINILTNYVNQNKEKLYRLSYSYLKQEELALDMIQEAIVKALAKVHTLRNPEYIKTWFYRILINECLSALRKKKQIEEWDRQDFDIAYEEKDTVDAMLLYEKIDQLKPKLKTVILLRYFEDMKIEEIAKATATNINTVKSRLYKALEKLKQDLKEEEKNEKTFQDS